MALALAPSGHLEAQVAKLNGPLARPTVGDVVDYLAAPEGDFVLLRANLGSGNVYELFVAPLDGSAPAERVHDPLPAGANIGGSSINIFGAGGQQDYQIAAGGRVLFIADIATDGVDELYSAPADRSASPVRLNGALAPNEDMWNFWITSDGQYAVYRALQVSGGTLFRVPVDGSAPATPLAPGLTVGSRVWLSPDGTFVVFTTPLDFGLRQELWVVPADGSAPPLSLGETPPPLNFGITGITNVLISEDNEDLVCFMVYDEDGDLTGHVFGARLDGTVPPPRLNIGIVSGYEEIAFDGDERALFREGWSLISARVDGGQRHVLTPPGWQALTTPLLTPDGNAVFPAFSGGVRTLFSAPTDGSTPAVELIAPVSAALYLLDIVGAHALYSVVSGSTWQLRAVPLAGGSSTLLNPPPFDAASAGLAAHPGGGDVLFLSEGGSAGMTRLFTVPIDGSALPRLLSGPLVASGDVRDFRIGAGGAQIAYRADATNNESFELFGVPHAGGPVVRLSPPLVPGPVLGDVDEFRVTEDGERVLYLADQDQDEAVGLYLTPPDARGTPRRLDAGLPEMHDVFPGFATSANGRHVVYLRADSPGSANGDLYAVDLATGGTPRLLDTDSARYEQELVLDAAATRVFYLRLRTFPVYDLVVARLDGSVAPDVLNQPTGMVDAFRITPDGATAIYRANTVSGGAFELYTIPSDGSAAPTKLSIPPVTGGNVTAFELSPDGARVVYLSDRDVDEQFELWSAPSDASAPALELNPALVAGGDVTHFLVTPDSAHVVYRADQNDDQTFELFRVPIGGGAAVALTAALPADRAAQADFVLAPDSQTVFFRANPAAQLRNELFRVPADGSAAPVALSGTLVAGGSVDAFQLATDGTRLVFLADARADNVKELSSVPATGGAPVLLQTLAATGDVTHFRIAPDDALVAWRADARTDGVYELFTAPLDGSAPARLQNAPLPSGGDVEADFLPLAAGRILFRADQEADGVLELFAAFEGTRGAHQAPTPTSTRTVVR